MIGLPRRRRRMLAAGAAGAVALGAAWAGASAVPPASAADVPVDDRVIVYYQKQFTDGYAEYISPAPLLHEGTGVDVVNLAAIHMNADVLNLNDLEPGSPLFDRMWADLAELQANGIAVVGMVGGAMNSSWENLEDDYDTQYPRLRDFVAEHGLDGVDLDVETGTDIAVVESVIADLESDFGPDFLITLSPVTAGLMGRDNLSGLDYDELYRRSGASIDWFNTQFYCGWGDPTAANYDAIARYQATRGAGIPASKIVLAVLTNPENCDEGWVPLDELTASFDVMRTAHPDFGGVAGWEYFNSLPGGEEEPWRWAAVMREALDRPVPTPTPNSTPTPTPTASPITPTATPVATPSAGELAATGSNGAAGFSVAAAAAAATAVGALAVGVTLTVRRRLRRAPR
ncbi:hypothetical protein GCM10009851_25140 [Herbiconiux moechotypicola]|uniref:GH18 domain-containing protein n=1 Tax=Herbiconiux moechotypicola TaxID=637393 RepID=A0ABP5QPJ9_9MICO|nr:glycosyl hydrolase family 18 protein [Herbiconiux moechotypicola]